MKGCTYQAMSALMPSDPNECRGYALRCAALAMNARSPQLKTMFMELSGNWQTLAMQLETTFARLGESEGSTCVRESLDEAKRPSILPIWNMMGID